MMSSQAQNNAVADTPETERPRQVAIAPLNAVAPLDLGRGARGVDDWLRQIGENGATLSALKQSCAPAPVAGNAIAAIATLCDLVRMARAAAPNVHDQASLAINLIGLVTEPASQAAARMTLRPMLFLARQELAKAQRPQLDDAAIALLRAHLNASIVGELSDFVTQAQGKLSGILGEAAALGTTLAVHLASGLRQLASTREASASKATSVVAEGAEGNLPRDPKALIDSVVSTAWSAFRQSPAADLSARGALSDDAARILIAHAKRLEALAGELPAQITAQADPGTEDSAGWLLTQLAAAVQHKPRPPLAAGVSPSKTNEGRLSHGDGTIEALATQCAAENDANQCKNVVASGTGCHISFATGSETIAHRDFTLTGLLPIEWVRTYRSSLDAYDQGPLGARWITPYTTRLDEVPGQGRNAPPTLRYHAADGRSHDYPLPEPGTNHHDPIEQVTLVRVTETLLSVARGIERQETYARHGTQWRLIALSYRSGARATLHYEHRVARHGVPDTALSDIITWQGEGGTPLTHVGTRLDAHGRIEGLWQIADGKLVRQLAHYEYAPEGDLAIAQCEHGTHWAYAYQHHLVTRYTDRTGRGMNLHWDGDSAHARAVREWADDGSFDTRLEWDEHIRLTYVTDAHGAETWHYYDILGYTYRIIHPDGLSEWLFRDAAKNVTRHVRPDGSVDAYDYDARGNLLRHTRADGSTLHYAWDDKDQLVKIRDAEGGLWQREYDPRGHLVKDTDPLGAVTAYAYDKAGLLIEITDAKGGTKALAYTAQGQLARYTDCSGKHSAWHYNPQGQLTRSTDAAGHCTHYAYEHGQLTTVTHPDQSEERFEYDAEGRLLAHTDAAARSTRWQYGTAGLVAGRTDAAGHELAYQWDRLGRLRALTNENGRRIDFQYDPLGRLLSETGFDGTLRQYAYDAASGVLTHAQEGAHFTQYTFDPLGRLTGRTAGWRTEAGHLRDALNETFAYNANGQLIQATNHEAQLQWFHDAAGNTVREHHHYLGTLNLSATEQALHVAVWRHDYDATGHRIATTRPDGHRIDWLNYGAGHVHGVLLDGQALLHIERDDLHREVLRQQGNRLTQTQDYDPLGRLTAQRLTQHTPPTPTAPDSSPDSAPRLQRRYQYDRSGQLTDIHDTRRGQIHYRYDPIGRLLEAHGKLGRETFDFDPAGNLLDADTHNTRTYQRGDGSLYHSTLTGQNRLLDNLLRHYTSTHYSWDEHGQLKTRTHHGRSEHFTWDAFGRLAHYRNDTLEVAYAYDALGRRIEKRAHAYYHPHLDDGELYQRKQQRLTQQKHDCGTTRYGWDGDQLAWECRYEAAEDPHNAWAPDTVSARTTHYLYAPGSFVPLAQAVHHQPMALHAAPHYRPNAPYDIDDDPLWVTECDPQTTPIETLAWYQCDHLGTPQELTDEHGNIAWSAHYKAWGQARQVISDAAKRAGIRNPLRFQGQYEDHETGLHYNRHRYYDPHSGRYISKDPIGLAGGMNVHAYAPNSTKWIDPLGLRCDSPAEKLRRKISALEGAQATADRVRNLSDGRIRYYDKEALARRVGPTRGRSHVTEWNPNTGQVRVWEETYDHTGAVNRVHPKMSNGEVLDLPHYPPTKTDIDQGKATPSGRAIGCPCRC
jgi:RHS repeat-associated protein